MMGKKGLSILLFSIMVFIAAPAAASDFLTHVPSDYFMVMHAPSVERVLQTSEQLAKALRAPSLSLGKPSAELEVMRQSGVDVAGEMAFIALDVPDKNAPDPGIIILARIADRALLERSTAIDAQGRGEIRGSGVKPIYVWVAGDYAMMAEKPAVLQRYQQRVETGKLSAQPAVKAAIDGNDATLFMNFPKVWSLMLTSLEAEDVKYQQVMEKLDPMTKMSLDEMEMVLFGYKNGLTDVRLTLLASVKPGGFNATMFDRYRENPLSGFSGLPAGQWALAGFFAGDSHAAAAYHDLTGKDYRPFLLPQQKAPDSLIELINQAQELNLLINGGRYAWYVNAAEPASGVLHGLYIFETSDAEKLNAKMAHLIKAVVDANKRDKAATWKLVDKTSKVKLGSLTASRIDLRFSAKGKSKGEPAPALLDFLRTVNGSETVSLYLLPYDQHTLLLGVGNASEKVQLAALTLKTGVNSLESDVQLVEARRRPADSNLAMTTIAVGRIIDAFGGTGTLFTSMLSQPVVISAGAADETLAVQVHVPDELLKLLLQFSRK